MRTEVSEGFGAETAAARLAERIERVPPGTVRLSADGRALLSPPMDATHDRFDGPASASAALVVFGAHRTPSSRPLGEVIERVRERHLVVWRHYPDPGAHPRAALFALAVEAAAARGKFWALTRQLLRLRHDDPQDLHAALLRAGLDPDRVGELMRAGTGADRVVADVASARASGVAFTPTLFVNGERYRGELTPAAVLAVLERS